MTDAVKILTPEERARRAGLIERLELGQRYRADGVSIECLALRELVDERDRLEQERDALAQRVDELEWLLRVVSGEERVVLPRPATHPAEEPEET